MYARQMRSPNPNPNPSPSPNPNPDQVAGVVKMILNAGLGAEDDP